MALRAASMDVGLTKDIYCPEPWWSRNPASNMIAINSPAELLHALVNDLLESEISDAVPVAKCWKSVDCDRLLREMVSVLQGAVPKGGFPELL